MEDTTRPNEATVEADEADAGREHPDRAPSADEEKRQSGAALSAMTLNRWPPTTRR